ncbi:sulfotransferase family 2 domain-containing protein [Sulfurimonas sp. HSL1-2]|uniref:sulfotransferase family 2 domain-containing protein n=1 Tax=Thiomicrolovo zhangzhouensis TaxID=3131933 RepID=UPI0031F96FAF
MIISDKYKFVFVHIPKCAGSYVRDKLIAYDDTNGMFTKRVAYHQDLGLLDYVHLPLSTLQQYFPEEYAKIKNYWSFVIVRDPYKRFPSSFSQHVLMYEKKRIYNLKRKEITRSLDKAISYLSQYGDQKQLPAEYIHFQKQKDYIYFEEEKIIDSLFLIDDLHTCQEVFKQNTGLDILFHKNDDKINEMVVVKNQALKTTLDFVRPLSDMVTKHFSEEVKQYIRSFVYVPRDKRFKDIFQSNYVLDFVSNYYKEDIDLVDRTGKVLKKVKLQKTEENL